LDESSGDGMARALEDDETLCPAGFTDRTL
jgi:hypothetical protein